MDRRLEAVRKSNLIHGKFPGQRKWMPFFLEAAACELRIYEGEVKSVQRKGRQLRTLKLDQSDLVGEEKSSKRSYKFFVQRPDGRYLFKCDSAEERGDWILQLQKATNTLTLRQVSGASPNAVSTTSYVHEKPPTKRSEHVDHGLEMKQYKWYWGLMNRKDCEVRMREEGQVGNFVVRVNSSGNHVMSCWVVRGAIVHSLIIREDNLFHFDKTPVHAEGSTIVEFIESYMNQPILNKLVPFGGSLSLSKDSEESSVVGYESQPGAAGQHHTPGVCIEMADSAPSPAFTRAFNDHNTVLHHRPTSPLVDDIPPFHASDTHKDTLHHRPTSPLVDDIPPFHASDTHKDTLHPRPISPLVDNIPSFSTFVSPSALSSRQRHHSDSDRKLFLTPQPKRKAFGAVHCHVQKTSSLESIPTNRLHATTDSDRKMFLTPQPKHKALGAVHHHVQKTSSLEGIPTNKVRTTTDSATKHYKRSEDDETTSPLASMQTQYKNWSAIYRNKMVSPEAAGHSLPMPTRTNKPSHEISGLEAKDTVAAEHKTQLPGSTSEPSQSTDCDHDYQNVPNSGGEKPDYVNWDVFQSTKF